MNVFALDNKLPNQVAFIKERKHKHTFQNKS